MYRSWSDRLLAAALASAAILAAGVVLVIASFVAVESFPALRAIGPARFLTDGSWYPTEGRFGLGSMVAGSLFLTVGAAGLATPVGFLSALFLYQFAPRPLAMVLRRVLELLAGIPSVVYGFWGLVTLVPILAQLRPPGQSLLAGVLVLAIMIVPTVALLAESSLAQVPPELVHGAAALGLGPLAALRRVVVPAALPGILSGVLLATSRAIGETMAVLMVTGNVPRFPAHPFSPVRALTANVALEMAYALGDHRSALFVSGLILVLVTGLLVWLAGRWAGHGREDGGAMR